MAENEPLQVEDENPFSLHIVLFVSTKDDWFFDMAYYLSYGECPPH